MRPGLHGTLPRRTALGSTRWIATAFPSWLAVLVLAFVSLSHAPPAARAGLLDGVAGGIGAPHRIGLSDTDLVLDKLRDKQVLTEVEWRELKDAIEKERAFTVKVGGLLQPRVIAYAGSDHVEGVPGDPNLRPGFQLRRARLSASGQAYWSWLRYFVQLDMVSRIDPTKFKTELADANIQLKDLIPYHTVSLGLGKPPFSRQHLAATSKLQFLERSVVVEELNDLFLDREIGLQASGRIPVLEEGLLFKYAAGVFNGNGKEGITGDLNEGKMVALRAQLDLFRDLGLDEGDLVSGSFGASVGGGWFYNRDITSEPMGWTADAEMRYQGFSVTGAYVQVDFQPDLEGGVELPEFTTSFKTRGWYLQTGMMVVPHLVELVARYDWYDSNDEIDDNGDVNSYTAGVNVYLADHDLKVSLDYVGRLEGKIDSDFAFDEAGAKLDNDSLTLQVQMVF